MVLRTVPRAIGGVPVGNPYGLGSLDALTPTAAAQQVFPNAPRSSSPGHNMAAFNLIQASAAAGQLLDVSGGVAYVPGSQDCAGASLLKPALLSTAGGLALKFAPEAFAAGPIVGGIVVAVAALSEMFAAIFGHHAAAIKKEQSILCAAVPAANQTLQLIDQAVQSGQATPQQAIAALNGMPAQFDAQVASIRHGADPTVSGECNAACLMATALRAIVIAKVSQYQDILAAAPAGGITSAVSQAAAQTGLPTWAILAAAAGILWWVL
jgi:hypothetical protein